MNPLERLMQMNRFDKETVELAKKLGYAEGYRDAQQNRPFKYLVEALAEITAKA